MRESLSSRIIKICEFCVSKGHKKRILRDSNNLKPFYLWRMIKQNTNYVNLFTIQPPLMNKLIPNFTSVTRKQNVTFVRHFKERSKNITKQERILTKQKKSNINKLYFSWNLEKFFRNCGNIAHQKSKFHIKKVKKATAFSKKPLKVRPSKKNGSR